MPWRCHRIVTPPAPLILSSPLWPLRVLRGLDRTRGEANAPVHRPCALVPRAPQAPRAQRAETLASLLWPLRVLRGLAKTRGAGGLQYTALVHQCRERRRPPERSEPRRSPPPYGRSASCAGSPEQGGRGVTVHRPRAPVPRAPQAPRAQRAETLASLLWPLRVLRGLDKQGGRGGYSTPASCTCAASAAGPPSAASRDARLPPCFDFGRGAAKRFGCRSRNKGGGRGTKRHERATPQ